MIEIRGLSQTYPGPQGPVEALRGIDLHIPPGEVFGIIGRSGAGKSSLVRTINLLNRPTAGAVIVNGRDLTRLSDAELRAARRDIGMVFQHFNLLHSRTVYDNVALPLELIGLSRADIRARVLPLLELVGLTALADRYPAQISGGQKQRVGIARALASQPKVLLSDEATSALDPETTRSILELLRKVNRDMGLTVVLITHQMQVIKQVADRVAVIEAGRIVEAGETYSVFSRPGHQTTRSFLQGVTGVAVPQFVAGQLRDAPQGIKAEAVVQVTFTGRHATDPMLARLTAERGVSVNILAGAIEEIGDQPFGSLIVGLPAGRLDESRRFLEDHGLMTEVLGYVG